MMLIENVMMIECDCDSLTLLLARMALTTVHQLVHVPVVMGHALKTTFPCPTRPSGDGRSESWHLRRGEIECQVALVVQTVRCITSLINNRIAQREGLLLSLVRMSRHSCLPNRRLTTMGFPGTTVGALNVRGCPQYNLPLQRRLPVIGRLITLPTQ